MRTMKLLCFGASCPSWDQVGKVRYQDILSVHIRLRGVSRSLGSKAPLRSVRYSIITSSKWLLKGGDDLFNILEHPGVGKNRMREQIYTTVAKQWLVEWQRLHVRNMQTSPGRYRGVFPRCILEHVHVQYQDPPTGHHLRPFKSTKSSISETCTVGC